jgi:hypothetical protein
MREHNGMPPEFGTAATRAGSTSTTTIYVAKCRQRHQIVSNVAVARVPALAAAALGHVRPCPNVTARLLVGDARRADELRENIRTMPRCTI